MNISMIKLHTVGFPPDKETDALNNEFMKRLGMPHRYQPARLAIARSLAIHTLPPNAGAKTTRVIKGDTLFGTGENLSTWVALVVEHACNEEIDKNRLTELVSAHWRRGIKLLDSEWQRSDDDMTKFVRRLVDAAEIPHNLPSADGGRLIGMETGGIGGLSNGQITVPVGEISEEIATKEKVQWNLNGAGGSPHSAIMGGVGSGKTRTAVAMLSNIHAQAPDVPLIAFDFKGDLSGGDNTYKLDQLFDARVASPPREAVPLDVLALYATDQVGVANAASRFRDAFSNLKGSRLGDRQRAAVYEAAERALAESPCELQTVLHHLTEVYEERGMKDDGATSAMNELCRFALFKPELDPVAFFRQSWIINLPQDMPADNRVIVVNLVLNALDSYLNSLADTEVDADGARALRALCMVDEAHQILKGKLPSLSNLIRMSRSKGGAIMLISQSPDDFSGEDDEFLSEMGLVAAFGTNASPKNVKRIFGGNANLASLRNFQCFVKLRGDQTSKKVQAWQTS